MKISKYTQKQNYLKTLLSPTVKYFAILYSYLSHRFCLNYYEANPRHDGVNWYLFLKKLNHKIMRNENKH